MNIVHPFHAMINFIINDRGPSVFFFVEDNHTILSSSVLGWRAVEQEDREGDDERTRCLAPGLLHSEAQPEE